MTILAVMIVVIYANAIAGDELSKVFLMLLQLPRNLQKMYLERHRLLFADPVGLVVLFVLFVLFVVINT
ncbi:MAG: hypothetical protein JO327_12885 [Nitrososphaeraceae archaeon]|nr:hypothetical protein [Nitrososphaeraceae archaeon]